MSNESNGFETMCRGMIIGVLVVVAGVAVGGLIYNLDTIFNGHTTTVEAVAPPAKMVCERVTDQSDPNVTRCRDTELHATCYRTNNGAGLALSCVPDQWLYTDQVEPNQTEK